MGKLNSSLYSESKKTFFRIVWEENTVFSVKVLLLCFLSKCYCWRLFGNIIPLLSHIGVDLKERSYHNGRHIVKATQRINQYYNGSTEKTLCRQVSTWNHNWVWALKNQKLNSNNQHSLKLIYDNLHYGYQTQL